MASVATGLNHAMGEFVAPAIRHLPANILIIAVALVFASSVGIWGLAWATLIGLAFEVIVQLPFLYRRGFRYGWSLDFHDPAIRQVGYLMIPVVMGTALTQVNTLVSRVFASLLPTGTISVLDYSSKLIGFVTGTVIAAVATVALSKFSSLAANEHEDKIGPAVSRALSSLNALVIPMTVGLMVLRVPIIRFIYERGAFTASDTQLTAQALLYASIGLVGTGMRDVSARGFYALRDTRTPMINGVTGMGVNVGLLFLLVRYLGWGIAGMALATACSVTYAGVMLTVLLFRRTGGLDLAGLTSSTGRTVIAALVMALVVGWFHPVAEGVVPGDGFISQAVELGAAIGIGGLVYVIVLTAVGSQEAKYGWALVRGVVSRFSGERG